MLPLLTGARSPQQGALGRVVCRRKAQGLQKSSGGSSGLQGSLLAQAALKHSSFHKYVPRTHCRLYFELGAGDSSFKGAKIPLLKESVF